MAEEARRDERIVLSELYARYPKDEYISILPNLFLSEALPDHLSFGVEVFSLSPNPEDGETYWLDAPKWNCGSYEKRAKTKPAAAKSDVPIDEGWLGLSKVAVQKFDVALSVKWIPEYNRRVDDGSNPDVFGYQAAGMIAGISGSTVETDQYWLDLRTEAEMKEIKTRQYFPDSVQDEHGKWIKTKDLSEERKDELVQFLVRKFILDRRHKAARICMTGARLRVLRNFTGLPQKFRPSVLRDKKFAVLTTVLRFDPKTETERIALQKELTSRFLPAYTPAAESSSVPEVHRDQPLFQPKAESEPLSLPAGDGPRGQAVLTEEDRTGIAAEHTETITTLPDGEVEDADYEEVIEGDSGRQENADTASEPPEPVRDSEPDSADPDAQSVEFRRQVDLYLSEIGGYKGVEKTKAFLRKTLNTFGLDDVKEATVIERPAILSKLSAELDGLSAKEAAKAPDAPFYAGKSYASILDTRKKGLEKKTPAQLKKAVNELITLYKYDMKKDSAGLSACLVRDGEEPKKSTLVEAALRVIAHGLDQTLRKTGVGENKQ